MDAMNLSRYIITKCTKDGKAISNLQLQWVLYYIQKEFLKRNTVAFYDMIERWRNGPVIPNVYFHYCGFGAAPIRMVYPDITMPELSVCRTIDAIVEEKRELKPWELTEVVSDNEGSD